MGPQETLALAERSGFAIRNFAEVSPHHYGVVFERLGQ
jgi:hypothetical protein